MRRFSVGLLLMVVLFAAGCGGGGGGGGGGSSSTQASGEATKPASQVVADAVKAANAASSVHMSGTVVDAGQQIAIDMTVAKGKGATGTLAVGKGSVDLVVIGNTAYMRASPAFWRKYTHSSGMGQLFAGKWLKFTGKNGQLKGLTDLTHVQGIFNKLTSSQGKLTNHGATTYNGQDVVAISDTPENGTLYVAASGTPYPVGLVKAGKSSSGGKLTFDRWDQPVTLTAPKGALDFSQFGGTG